MFWRTDVYVLNPVGSVKHSILIRHLMVEEFLISSQAKTRPTCRSRVRCALKITLHSSQIVLSKRATIHRPSCLADSVRVIFGHSALCRRLALNESTTNSILPIRASPKPCLCQPGPTKSPLVRSGSWNEFTMSEPTSEFRTGILFAQRPPSLLPRKSFFPFGLHQQMTLLH
jgi:hypothetical protein